MTNSPTEQKKPDAKDAGQLPNLVTIVGRGVPSNYEISVAGQIEMEGYEPFEEATIVSGGAAEGAIDVGVQRFRFSGDLANVRVADWNGVEGAASSSTSTVHIDYGVPER